MIIYLYKKTHNITGLMYLGKTIKDPNKYLGSGKDWLSHLEEFGTDVSTEILKECHSREDLSYWGRYYSDLWSVVESSEWANRIPETGGGPGRRGYHSGSNNPMFGRTRPDLSGENSINKDPIKRLKSSIGAKTLWERPGYREQASKKRKDKWKQLEYLKKMNERPKQYKKVMIEGVQYNSLQEAALSLNLHPSTVSKRCSSSHSKFTGWFIID
jgi:hypothetical protein